MENDSIRASGSDTLVDLWIDGKLRAISISQEAIGAFLGFERAAGMSDEDRCEFVRSHLPLVMTAAKARLSATNPAADVVSIDVGDLPNTDGRSGDRRNADRRQAERRKSARPDANQPDRRRGDRRTGQRRRPSKPSDS